jgi:hypothetical protein
MQVDYQHLPPLVKLIFKHILQGLMVIQMVDLIVIRHVISMFS